MKVEKSGRLEFFKALYDEAVAALEENFAKLEQHFAQYRGDAAIDPMPDADGSGEMPARASVVRNITYELIESQTTTYIPVPKCDPVSVSDRSVRCALAAEKMLRAQRDRLPVEELNDLDERYTYVYGGSVWLAEWDESSVTHTKAGDVKLYCLSPRHFVGQPYIYRIEDMEYLFVTFETTKEDLVRKYGVSFSEAEETTNDEDGDDKTATMYVCYYKNENDDICQYIWSGDVELYDVENYYSRKREVCKRCGKKRQICECEDAEYETLDEDFEELTTDIILSDGVTVIPAMQQKIGEDGLPVTKTREVQRSEGGGALFGVDSATGLTLPVTDTVDEPVKEPTRLPFYKPKSFPVVIRKNTSREKSVLGQSDCEFIRPQQQAINKIETRIMQKLMRSGVTPVMPDDASVTLNNSVFGQVIRLKPGEQGQYGVVDTQVDISRDIAAAERLYDHAKRILGISESFQGHYDASAKSGVAKQTQAAQSAGRLDSKRVMKNAAWAAIDRIIFELELAFADEPRPVTYVDEFGNVQEVQFSRYDFLVRGERGEWYYDDEYLFSCDTSADISTDRPLLWQENRLNFEKGTYGDPKDPKTQLNFWLNMERAHYPFAHEQVKRAQEAIRSAAEMQKMQEQLAAMQQENAVLMQENEARTKYGDKMLEIASAENEELKNRREYEKFLRD